MSQKVIICGFPHCGTSILKSIIGHIEDVEEIYKEVSNINDISTDKKFILCKFPFTYDSFFEEKYEDYIKIFIIRNPLFVFSSLNKRFNSRLPAGHSIDDYINTIKKFIKYVNNIEKTIYTIRYEDIFDNNFEALRIILDDIGFKYDDNIFKNTNYKNVIFPGVKLSDKKPNNVSHETYRTWQINQPFVSNNDVSKLYLNENQIKKITSDPYILQIYNNLHNSFKPSLNIIS